MPEEIEETSDWKAHWVCTSCKCALKERSQICPKCGSVNAIYALPARLITVYDGKKTFFRPKGRVIREHWEIKEI